MSEQRRLLHDLIVANTQAYSGINGALKDVSSSLEALAETSKQSADFVSEIRTERKAFYNYAVKLSIALHIVELLVIILLLSKVDPDKVGGIFGVLASILRAI